MGGQPQGIAPTEGGCRSKVIFHCGWFDFISESKNSFLAQMNNSMDNLRNPNPDEFVWWGEQSFLGEMMIGYFMLLAGMSD